MNICLHNSVGIVCPCEAVLYCKIELKCREHVNIYWVPPPLVLPLSQPSDIWPLFEKLC